MQEDELDTAFRGFLDNGVPERPNEHELSPTELVGTHMYAIRELTRRVKRKNN